jgi:uncharacterized delta-60 repeat protein
MKLTLRIITSVASLMLACVAPAAAAPGDLDSSFGDGGRVTTSFGGGDDFASDVVVQPDGRIVVAGSTAVGGTQDFALARYLSDGSPDRSFSDDGRVTTAFPTGEGLERASGVALQPDGKIVASGGAGEFAVARYNVDGTLDTTFSGDGLQTVDVGTYESSASDVAVDALGRIILVGVGRNFDPVNFMDSAVARLAPDGSPDMTFGYNGVYTLDPVRRGSGTSRGGRPAARRRVHGDRRLGLHRGSPTGAGDEAVRSERRRGRGLQSV